VGGRLFVYKRKLRDSNPSPLVYPTIATGYRLGFTVTPFSRRSWSYRLFIIEIIIIIIIISMYLCKLFRYEEATSERAKQLIAKETGMKQHCAVEKLSNYLGMSECSQPDGMHTVKDFIENLFKLINGDTDKPSVRAAEVDLDRFDQVIEVIIYHIYWLSLKHLSISLGSKLIFLQFVVTYFMDHNNNQYFENQYFWAPSTRQ
jgi:hypothetical protein